MGRRSTILNIAAVNLVTTPTAAIGKTQQLNSSRGVRVDINISSISGAGAHNAVATLEAYDDAADAWFTVLASAAKTAAGRFVLTVFPGATATANVSANEVLPQTFRLKLTGTATAITATAYASFVGF